MSLKKQIDSFKDLLALLMHPVSKENLDDLMGYPHLQKAFPCFTGGNIDKLICETPAELLEREGIHCAPWLLLSMEERERRARTRLRARPELMQAIQKGLVWHTMGDREQDALQRDLRNAFYIGKMEEVKTALNFLCRNHRDSGGAGNAFSFLLPWNDAPWISKMPVVLLDMMIPFYLPVANAHFAPTENLTKAILQSPTKWSDNSLFSVADQLLLQGKVTEAQKLLAKLPDTLRKTLSTAFCDYLLGNNEEAIQNYRHILQNIKNPSAMFQMIPGFFYFFALLRDGSATAMTDLQEHTKALLKHPILLPLGKALLQLQSRKHPPQEEPSSKEETVGLQFPLLNLCTITIQSWNEEADISSLLRGIEQILEGADSSYKWAIREARNVEALLQDKEPDGVSLENLTGISNCIHTPPLWERTLDKLVKLMSTPKAKCSYRLAWECAVDKHPTCPFVLYPLEQHTNSKGRWYGGQKYPLLEHTANHSWPTHITQQDRLVCSILADPTQSEALPGNGFRSLAGLNALQGHPHLFWRGEKSSTFQCIASTPTIFFRKEKDDLLLEIQPHFPEKKNSDKESIVPIKDAQGNLRLFMFTPRQRAIAEHLPQNFRLPVIQKRGLFPYLPLIASTFPILSDTNLNPGTYPVQEGNLILHLKLVPAEELDQMTVEAFFQPFTENGELYPPAQGPQFLIGMQNGSPYQVKRDFGKELDAIQSLLEKSPSLHTQENSEASWLITGLEERYNFFLQLQELGSQVVVHWPENKKINITRKLSVNDLSINCQSAGDWLSIDGAIKVNDSLVLSLKEILNATQEQKGNFIQLEQDQIITISETLKQRLKDLHAIAIGDSDGNLKISQYAVPFLNGLFKQLSASAHDQENLMKFASAIDEAMALTPEVPKEFRATLRPYQREGFVWLSRLYAWGNNGACLADDMGLGKTVQTLALLLAKADEGPSIVVAPTSVCENWREECQKFTPTLNATIFGGLKRLSSLKKLGPGDLLICSYGLLQSEDEAFQKIRWNIAVLDEAQAIKNPRTQRSKAVINLNAKFRMVTTGTPLENNLTEFWSIFHFLTPGLLGDKDEFTTQFAMPIEKDKDKSVLKRLSQIVSPFILRRKKTQVLPDLPQRTEIPLWIQLSDQETAFYEGLRQNLLRELHPAFAAKTKMRFKVIAAITKLREAACNPRLIQPSCNIESSKLAKCNELIDSLLKEGHKILVFSQFVTHLALIRPELEKRGIHYQYLDGTTPIQERNAAVHDFQKGKGNVFLISLKAGGVGLNLTEADYVIHMDPWWNPAVEDQASDRAHRIGQQKPVTIYRLIAKNTIEKKIIELHEKKRHLADNLLAGTDSIQKISSEELYHLLMD